MSASASKSALLLSPCLRWAWTGAKRYDDSLSTSEKRDKGNVFHAGMDDHYKTGTSRVKDNDVQHWVDLAVEWSTHHLEPRCETIHSEVYVGYNFQTGQVHADPSVFARKYPYMPGYLHGTADLVCILTTGELLVADWKTGSGVGADKQLLTLACGLRKVYPKDGGVYRDVLLSTLYAGTQAGDKGCLPVEWAASDADLRAHEDAMAFQLADVGKHNEPVVGIHCTQLYCPHLAYCPGITGIVENESESPQALLRPEKLVRKYQMTDVPSSDQEAGYTMERITAARRQMDYYEAAIRKYASNGGRVISGDFEFSKKADGFRWRPLK